MSLYYNNLFMADPKNFIDTYTVDIKTWFENLNRANNQANTIGRALVEAAGAVGACRVDLAPVGGFMGVGVSTVQFRFVQNAGIDAYWAPYHAGLGLPGYTDVLKVNPPCKFVFTAGMNGCAFVVTDSPKGAAYMRVYHNQHPQVASVMQDIHNVGQAVISYADFGDYGGVALAYGVNPVAFNFLYYRNGVWNYIFQPQSFAALAQSPPQRQVGQSSMRSVF